MSFSDSLPGSRWLSLALSGSHPGWWDGAYLRVAPRRGALAVATTLVGEGEPAGLAGDPVGGGQSDTGKGARGKDEKEQEAMHGDRFQT